MGLCQALKAEYIEDREKGPRSLPNLVQPMIRARHNNSPHFWEYIGYSLPTLPWICRIPKWAGWRWVYGLTSLLHGGLWSMTRMQGWRGRCNTLDKDTAAGALSCVPGSSSRHS